MSIYLAYGSNLNMRQMAQRCPDAVPIGVGILPHAQLVFRGSRTGAYLTVEPHPTSSVPVGVWETSQADERKLDRYEGYPSFYGKYSLPFRFQDIQTTEEREEKCYLYLMHHTNPKGVPSRFYIRTCEEGYGDFSFPLEVLHDAMQRSLAERGTRGETYAIDEFVLRLAQRD